MTLRELLEGAAQAHGNRVALRFKVGDAWQTCSYSELLERVHRVAYFLGGLGLQPSDRVAMLLPNCPEWPEIYFGITSLGLTAVPMDAKLRAQEIEFILRDSGARAIFCAEPDTASVSELRAQLPTLATIIVVGGSTTQPDALAYEQCFSAVPAHGAPARARPQPDDLASLIYTSGTTGQAKGVMLTHGNFISNGTAMCQTIEIYPADNFLLVLPLHHALAFASNLLVPVASGSAISFVESVKTFGDDLRATQPTVLIGVPLLFEKMYRRVQENPQATLIGRLLLRLGLLGLVRRRIRARFGDKLRAMITGG
ncbi:MAG: long-chain fatty acid--CoA ligase, partial [Kiritimatiellaeota bacterium]|nr:long-chain fatty acid--CoA ligase [Kiritimatiellota bacterium]